MIINGDVFHSKLKTIKYMLLEKYFEKVIVRYGFLKTNIMEYKK